MKKAGMLVIVCASFFMQNVKAQKLSATEVTKMISNKNFVFEAETMLPMRGISRHLTFGYSLKFSGDTLVCYLPYFGESYSAPVNGKSSFDFTTTSYIYKVSKTKKGGYLIGALTNDNVYNKNFSLTVYNNGSAYLQVTSTNSQAISYNGYIKSVY